MTDEGLTFNALRGANVDRLSLFENAKGKPAHKNPDGSDWIPAQWLQAMVGEVGEYANVRKKYERGDFGDIDSEEAQSIFKVEAANELADVAIYLDLLAYRLGIDLGKAITTKWNAKSKQLGIPMQLKGDSWYFNDTTRRPSSDEPDNIEEVIRSIREWIMKHDEATVDFLWPVIEMLNEW